MGVKSFLDRFAWMTSKFHIDPDDVLRTKLVAKRPPWPKMSEGKHGITTNKKAET